MSRPMTEDRRPADHRLGATGVSSAFGTFGELLQGVLPEEDGDFLVTLPIARWAMARFVLQPERSEVLLWPPHKAKAGRLVRMILDDESPSAGGVLTIDSTLPEGKGLASSSADLVATARAVGNALGVPMPPRRIESYLAAIEPTDGVLYPSVVAYHHRSVRLRAALGSLPSMAVVSIDEGGEVDTVAFNAIPKPFTRADQREYARLLDRLAGAVAARDLAEVGRVATASARANQKLRYKWSLEAMIAICDSVGGLGVVVGHSGTTLGVLLNIQQASHYRGRLATAAQACHELADNVTIYHTLSFD